MKDKISKHIFEIISLIVIIVDIIFVWKINYLKYIVTDKLDEPIVAAWSNSYYKQTEAFANHSLSFINTEDKLKKLSNPYNPSERNGIFHYFDTSYYKGKYYSYYTIIPIIFVMLPIYIFSHKYFNLVIINIINVFLTLFISSKLYKMFRDKYFHKIPNWLSILGFITIIFISNVNMLIRGSKYDTGPSTGIFMIMLTIYLLYILRNNKYVRSKYIFAGITTAFIVLSKPSYIIYYPLIFYIFYETQFGYIKDKKKIIYYVVPIIVLAIFQMIYNYLRFDNILEFGTKYQLTSFNVYCYQSFSLNRFVRCLKLYIFNGPYFNISRFPYIFIKRAFDNDLYNEYLYGNFCLGLISVPVVFITFISLVKQKIKNSITYYLVIIIYIFILLVLVNSSFAGISETYFMEYKFLSSFFCVIYILINLQHQKRFIKITRIIVSIFFILNMLLIIPCTYVGSGNSFGVLSYDIEEVFNE